MRLPASDPIFAETSRPFPKVSMLSTLQNLYFSENKPAELTPLDIALTSYLILRQTEDHFIFDSQDTLATRLGCERKSIARSLHRLEGFKWITIKRRTEFNPVTKRRGIDKTAGISINLHTLPQDRAKRTAPSPTALAFAEDYVQALRQAGRNKFDKNFERRQAHTAQRFLDELEQDDAALLDLVNFALKQPTFKKDAQESLYRLWLRRQRLLAAFKISSQELAGTQLQRA
jgi:hypothetical protein